MPSLGVEDAKLARSTATRHITPLFQPYLCFFPHALPTLNHLEFPSTSHADSGFSTLESSRTLPHSHCIISSDISGNPVDYVDRTTFFVDIVKYLGATRTAILSSTR